MLYTWGFDIYLSRVSLKTLAATLLLLLVGQGAFCSDIDKAAKKEARYIYKEGLVAFSYGNEDAALKLFSESLKIFKGYPYPLFAMGRIYQVRFEDTMQYYTEAVEAYERLTDLFLVNSKLKPTKGLLQVYHYKGLLYLKGGEYQKAVNALDKYIELYPNDTDLDSIYNAIGISYYYLNEYDRAVIYFKRALDINPAFNEARFNMRSVFTRITAFNEALVLYKTGESKRALRRLEALRDIAPRYLPAMDLEAKILLYGGDKAGAVDVFNEILGLYPSHPKSYWIRIEMARALMGLGKMRLARDALIDNLARFPLQEDMMAKVELMRLLAQIGNAQ